MSETKTLVVTIPPNDPGKFAHEIADRLDQVAAPKLIRTDEDGAQHWEITVRAV